MMLSDIFVLTGFGLVDPILAVYFSDHIAGASVFAIGFASSLFLIVKSLVQLPFARHIDKYDDQNDMKWLIVGTFLISSVPFLYIYADHINMIYLAQMLYGIGSGLAYPAWLGLWSTHLDKNRESFEWSLYSTLTSIGAAVTATAGAAMAHFFGFNATFIATGILSFLGCAVIFYLKIKSWEGRSVPVALADKTLSDIGRGDE